MVKRSFTGTVDWFFLLDLVLETMNKLVLLLRLSEQAGFSFDGNNMFADKLHISALSRTKPSFNFFFFSELLHKDEYRETLQRGLETKQISHDFQRVRNRKLETLWKPRSRLCLKLQLPGIQGSDDDDAYWVGSCCVFKWCCFTFSHLLAQIYRRLFFLS